MSVIINYKICDNSSACSGIEVCPNGVFSYNKKTKKLEVDNSKCISCGLCEKSCPIGAIGVAKTDKEYKALEKAIENDPRSSEDLFVERYGADIINKKIQINENELNDLLLKKEDCIIELFDDNSINCLLKSIPIEEIKNKIKIKRYYKCFSDRNLSQKYKIKELPSLIINCKNKIKIIQGYYQEDNKKELLNQL